MQHGFNDIISWFSAKNLRAATVNKSIVHGVLSHDVESIESIVQQVTFVELVDAFLEYKIHLN